MRHGPQTEGGAIVFCVELVITGILLAASRPERRRLLDTLQEARAVSPDTAMSAYQLLGDRSGPLDRLVREGLVAVTADNRYYAIEARVQAARRRARWVVMGIGIVLALGLVWAVRRW
jgi:hypothetical protein